MKIVILDGVHTNPGDLDWDRLAELGELTVYERTSPDQAIARAKDADIVITNKVVFDAPVLAQLPGLRYIGVLATGYNVVDLEAAGRQGIVVTNVPAYSTESVAQTAFSFMLAFANHVCEHSLGVHDGKWCRSIDFCYRDFPIVELAEKTLGIVGFGQIGRAVARIALAFNMRVIVHTRTVPPEGFEGSSFVCLEEVFRQSDFLSLHCPLTEATEGMVNSGTLGLMKPAAFLINTGRGPLIDEQALADALNSGRIAGAGLDVLSSEPPKPDNPLIGAKNCYITPHIAWTSTEARKRLIDVVSENVAAFLAGEPVNVVN